MYRYRECGLDFVYLANGYEIHETDYGTGVAIEAADSLDRAIAAALLRSTKRLSGQCVRFLRSQMDLTQKELADRVGTRRVTVARWEAKPHTPIPGAADRVLRVVYAGHLNSADLLDDVVVLFPEIGDAPETGLTMHCVNFSGAAPANDSDRGDWKLQAALG